MSNENASRDSNRVTTLLGVTDDSAQEVRQLLVDPTTGRLLVAATGGAGGGDVVGPGLSTDNAVVRFNGTSGVSIQNSGVIIDDNDAITGVTKETITSNDSGTDPHSFILTNSASGGATWNMGVSATGSGTVVAGRFYINGPNGYNMQFASTNAGVYGGFYSGGANAWSLGGAALAGSTNTSTVFGASNGSSGAITANNSYARLFVAAGTVTEGTSGTHPMIASAAILAQTITAGAASVTDTATLYIDNAMSATVTGANYAVWIDAGTVRVDDTLQVDTLQTSGSSGIAIKNSGGTTVLTIGPTNSTGSTFAGAVNFGGAASPSTTDGAALGGTGNQWSDLFLASGAVVNYSNGDYTLTHSTGLLTASGSFSVGTSNAITAGTIELGNASDTTLSRSAAGVLAVEGVAVPTISSTSTLTNKIVRHTVEPAADDTYTGEDITGFNATATIAQWDAVYLSTTGWALTDADAASTAGGVMIGLAVAAGTASNPLTVVTRGVIRNDGWTWTTVGAPLYLSTTAGALTETAPSGTDDVQRIVGYVLSDDCIYFNPSNDWITRV